MARTQIESHGGVVEKFIGDAVVGVFGVPSAHEDDPERAIRAALRICQNAEGLEAIGGAPLRLRVGINTGETLVRLGVTPGSGERMLAGDAINTASRIQSVAPEMGVAVGTTTFETTAQVFDYEELERLGRRRAGLRGSRGTNRPIQKCSRASVRVDGTWSGPSRPGRPVDAVSPLRSVREIFESLGAAPATAQTDALLRQTIDWVDDRRSWSTLG